MPFSSPLADVEIPEVSVPQLVIGPAAARGDHPALIDGRTGQTLTYAQLAHMVDRLAAGLAEAGLRPGDVLALFSPNTLLYPVVFHAALAAGATVTTVNALATEKDLTTQLSDSGAKLLVTVSPFLDRAMAAAAHVQEILVCDTAEGHRSVQELMATTAPAPAVVLDPATALAVLPYSSGTTGVAKGVMLTHRNLVANIAQTQQVVKYDPADRVLAVLPFFHIYGLTVLMNMALSKGATLVVLPRFDLVEFLTAMADQKVSRAFVAPPIVLALAKHPLVDQYDLSALQVVFSGAAPLDGDLAQACAARLGCLVQQGYGMTELSPVSHAQSHGDTRVKPGTVGPLIPNTLARVVDVATGDDLGVGEPGELWIKGPQVMQGYLGRREDTDATVDADGWLHTGDVGLVDADGDWFIVDRVKELIKYKGYQVPPAELEAVLLGHPQIADAAVVAGHDADGEEIPHAFVAAAPGAGLTAQDVKDYVAERVAPYKRVRAVTFVDAIPKSASGKILRKDLRAQL
ncbi:4-coumarate--CoA ligase family protein [Catellatospora citrea]|uniref:AMP-dependent synthetase n=1 Tax=Catellatospora citrea TaxID=53366 RepID=A0A8J3K700_9ACTN|nr:4-coumarate--CoA ligase family protein [Catellatospora citrea]RKE10251.1 acyl-CoA synthetase (AMP-forming)/AMP-acid ligase II [Catellatospora citrea]GIF97836.1 AMP-dependent synthetase [Catellatospora citrea]